MSTRPLVIFHAQCADGFCAAWLAWEFFKVNDGFKDTPTADFVPAQYGNKVPDVRDRDVFILDFSYKKMQTLEIIRDCKSLVIIDHHATSQDELAFIQQQKDGGVESKIAQTTCIFDMTKSGAQLTWEYFAAIDQKRYTLARLPFRKVPWLVRYTQDRDLWQWRLDKSKEISAFIGSYSFEPTEENFYRWTEWSTYKKDDFAFMDMDSFFEMSSQGGAILRYQQRVVDAAVKNAVEIDLDGHKVLCVNATTMISEIAGALAVGRDFGATFFMRGDGKKIWSLRSRDGVVNVAEIAKRHGGGGHPAAAGFQE